jgi:hypothetical protein
MKALGLLIALVCGSMLACGRLTPSEPPARVVSDSTLAHMRFLFVEWPDSVHIGQVATAEVIVVGPLGTSVQTDSIFWTADSTRLIGLLPVRTGDESKRVVARAAGAATVALRAWVYQPHKRENGNLERGYYSDTTRLVLVVP